jgi:uncharacterized protein YwqG
MDSTTELLRGELRMLAERHLGAELADRIVELARPSVRLVRTTAGSMSRLGGDPVLPPGTPWPHWRDRPLSFLALIDVSEIPLDGFPDSPRLLNFFYDAERQRAWGYRPRHAGGWRVLGADIGDGWLTRPPEGALRFEARALGPERTLTIPGWEENVLADLSKEDQDRFDALTDAWRELTGPVGEPDHLVGGWPNLIQAPLWEQAQLASNGLEIGHSHGYSGKQAAALRDGIGNWRLLLQLDSDDDLKWAWGDFGRLYFVITEDDLRTGEFGRTWMVLQCG